jgi:hypothetical protein
MDVDQDPISELRQTLRARPTTWEPERAPRRLRPVSRVRQLPHPRSVAARSVLTHVRWPDLHPHLDIDWRRAGLAIGRLLSATWPVVVALAVAVGVVSRWAARAADRGFWVIVHALRAAGRHVWRFGTWSVATVARARPRRTVRPAAREPSPVEPDAIEPDPIPNADDGERHLEDLERRQLEQRIEALGPDHPDVAILLQLVAERCAARGASDEALRLYARALRIQETTFGPDSPALRPLLGDLAELELELGHDGEALLHRARRELLEPRAAALADRIRLDGVLVSHTSDKPTGASRAN